MATNLPNWPASLPCPRVDDCSYTSDSNVIRTQMDSGFARQRRRSTAVAEQVTFSMVMSAAEVQIVRDFVSITLGDVLPFLWREFRVPPGQIVPATYRFKSRPSISPHPSGRYWIVSLDLELITNSQARYLLDVSDGTTGLTNT